MDSFNESLKRLDRALEALRRFNEIERRLEQLYRRVRRLAWGNRSQSIERIEREINDLTAELRSIK